MPGAPREKSIVEIAEEIEKAMLAKKEKKEKDKKMYYELFKKYFEENGAVEYDEWQSKLGEIARKNGKIIVRRENPETFLTVFKNKKNLPIAFSAEHGKQPNSALLGNDLAGLRLALAGGFGKIGKGSVAITVGFEPSENLSIKDVPDGKFTNFSGSERSLVKIVQGDVPFEKMKFFLLRMPYGLFPESEMTEDELEKEPASIQRIFIPEKYQKKEKGPESIASWS